MQEQLLERLGERLGERAPQSLRFRVGRCAEINFILSVICRDFYSSDGVCQTAGTGILMSTCISTPTPACSKCPDGRGFL